jgi:hypothetical protein
MKTIIFLLLLWQTVFGLQKSFAQASDAKPNGIVPPSFTSIQRNQIAIPTQGQLIFNVNDSCLNVFKVNKWVALKTADVNTSSTQSNNIFNEPNSLIKLDDNGNLTSPAPTAPSIPYTAATLLNSWVNSLLANNEFEVAGYFKDLEGIVSLRGLIRGGTVTLNTNIFILPPGYRPSERLIFIVNNSGVAGRVDILPTGEVMRVTGGNTFLSLSRIDFRANGN